MDAEEAEMEAILGGEGPDTPPAQAEEATPAATPQVEATPAETNLETEGTPAGQEPPAKSEEDDSAVSQLPPDKSKKPQYRLRPNDETEALALEMMRSAQKAGAPLSLKDALVEAERITKKPEDGTPANEPQNELAAVDTELAEVRQKLDQFAADESLYTPEVRKAQQRELELVAQKARLEAAEQVAQAQQAQAANQQFETAEAESWSKAAEIFPDIANKDSALSQKVAAEWNAIADNPNHPLYNLPDLPETLTAKHAALLRIAPTAANATPAPAKPAAVAPSHSTPIQPVPGSAGRSAPPGQVTEAQREAQTIAALANARSDDEFEALLEKDLATDPSPSTLGYRL